MFYNIGKKIQYVAVALGVSTLIGGFIAFIHYITNGYTDKNSLGFDYYVYITNDDWIGFVYLVGGIVSSLLFTFVLYAFGQLVDDVNVLRHHLVKKETQVAAVVQPNPQPTHAPSIFKDDSPELPGAPNPKGTWVCTCGKTNAPYTSSCSCGVNKRDIK